MGMRSSSEKIQRNKWIKLYRLQANWAQMITQVQCWTIFKCKEQCSDTMRG